MAEHHFTAFALAGELDLSRVGAHLGIIRKYRWEEPLLLHPATFQPIGGDRSEQHQVYLYYFGGVVFLNCTDETIRDFSREMAKVSENFKEFPNIKYQEHYSLQIESGGELTITNDCAVMPRYEHAFIDIIAFVIAKSVALERIEEQVGKVLDEMEGLIALLEQGKLGIPDKRLAKLASKILNFKYRSLAYIMVLDKPDITWDNPEADRFYLTMANLFELSQRYQEIRHKSEALMDITQVFTGLSHARRASFLEWIIIILIAIEIALFLLEMFRR
ncbi:MAG TPA: RMD1 family protein [Geobacteraceae bacterium]|nr:RMD1 family protein [Geobacteraceae bacterium]